jgi:ABC-2 type transport system permease protein
MQVAAVFSPALAVRQTSMAGAATDLETHVRFLDQAEAYRFDLIQRLNRVHAEQVQAADDAARSRDAEAERRTRVAAQTWADLPEFRFRPATPETRAASMVPGLVVLAGWLVVVLGLLLPAARRLEEDAR